MTTKRPGFTRDHGAAKVVYHRADCPPDSDKEGHYIVQGDDGRFLPHPGSNG